MHEKVLTRYYCVREIDEDGTVWYVAEEPQSGARAQAEDVEDAVKNVLEENTENAC